MQQSYIKRQRITAVQFLAVSNIVRATALNEIMFQEYYIYGNLFAIYGSIL